MSDATTKQAPHVKSAQEKAAEDAVEQLRKLGGEQFREEAVEFNGRKVILPAGSTLDSNIKFLKQLAAEEAEEAQFMRRYKFRPTDGLVALTRALKEAFGAVHHAGSIGFFGPNPPRLITVDVGYDQTEQVLNLGDRISIPALPGVELIPVGDEDDDLGEVFVLYANGLKRQRFEVEGLFNLVEMHLREKSIYRGEAITAGFEFLNLGKVNPDQVVYSEQVMFELERSVFGPIEYGDRLVEAGIDLKGAVLLNGPFGTGKTLAAYLTGQRAVQKDWTFILCGSEHNLFDALKAARQYAPAIVFYEDVEVLTSDADAERIQLLLEAFDGLRRKGEDIRVVMTTNHPEKIHKGLIRPGRIDAVIEIGHPDAGAIRKLVELNCPSLDNSITDESWDEVTSAMEGYLPAFVVEAVKRAFMAALLRASKHGGEALVSSQDLKLAGQSLKAQLDLMNGASTLQDADPLSIAFQRVVMPLVQPGAEDALLEQLNPQLLVGEKKKQR